jgi:rod shape-determining protein MreB
MLFRKTLGLDLGTDTTQIYLGGSGIVVNEPTIVAVNTLTNGIVAVGEEAKKMLARTPSHITAVRPVLGGVIADFDLAKELIQALVENNNIPWSWLTRAIVSVPTSLTEVERKSVEDLLKEIGLNPVYVLEQPLAAAFGGRLPVGQPTAHFIVDVGAGTTDMAIISLDGIVVSKRLKIAGNYMNQEIIKGVRDEFKLIIGEPTAEEIKIQVGSVLPWSEKLEIVVRGRDLQSGLPRELTLKDSQVRFWLQRPAKNIVDAAKDLLESAPPELVGDIYKNGIYLCGGGSLIRGLDQLFEKEIGVGVQTVEDPLTCVARGAGIFCDRFEELNHLLHNQPRSPIS